jgi:glycosyltransferase involved in cell wall biosynthesis
LSSKNGVHVVNSEGMGVALANIYSGINEIIAISNAAILSLDNCNHVSEVSSRSKGCLRIGFMGYFDDHKGVDFFVDVIGGLNSSSDISVVGKAVGPVYDQEFFSELLSRSPNNIDFSGPVYGEEMTAFFNDIDILLFPSKYLNEAEPLVVHNGLAYGVPVISTNRGCLTDVLKGYELCNVFDEASYVGKAQAFITSNYLSFRDPNLKNAIRKRYALALKEHRKSLENLINRLILDIS